MLENYTQWIHHGEHFQLDNVNQCGDSYDGGDFDDQVHDQDNNVQRMLNDMHR